MQNNDKANFMNALFQESLIKPMLKHNKICTLKLIYASVTLKIKQARPLRFAYNNNQIKNIAVHPFYPDARHHLASLPLHTPG